jgi:Carboxypeptidase regulatory-like domain
MKSPGVGITGIKTWTILGLLSVFTLLSTAAAQRDQAEEPTAVLNFVVIKEDNGKPVRSAAVIMHPVNAHGKQSRGGLELKTDADGKTSFDGIPYGTLRVQVLASGFQTFGEDYEVNRSKLDLTIKLKRPQGQYSIYQNHPEEKKDDNTPPPPDPNAKPQ